MKNSIRIQVLILFFIGIFVFMSVNADNGNGTGTRSSVVVDKEAVPILKTLTGKMSKSDTVVYVYITTNGKKYHKETCGYLKKSKIKIKLEDAKLRGYTACSRCKPPK